MYEVTIHDLPDEVLENILHRLRLNDRKMALRVCKRWSALKLIDFSSDQLVVNVDTLDEKEYQDYRRPWLTAGRRYKHLALVFNIYSPEKRDLAMDIVRIFSESLESLKLSVGKRQRPMDIQLLVQISTLLSKLKHLHVNGLRFFGHRRAFRLNPELTFSPMNNLEGLCLWCTELSSIPNLQDITPNIIRLNIDIDSQESINLIRHFSLQLVQLQGYINGKVFNPFVQLVYRSLENIKYLHLQRSCCVRFPISENMMLAVCKLKHLKTLHFGYFKIIVPSQFYGQPLDSLRVLSLEAVLIDTVQFNNFCQHAFPKLTHLKLKRIKANGCATLGQYKTICSGMSTMKRLEIDEPRRCLSIRMLLGFCMAFELREVRITCRTLKPSYPMNDPFSSPLEILIIDALECTAPLESLQSLIKSLDKLKRFELTVRSRMILQPEEIHNLQKAFPLCVIVISLSGTKTSDTAVRTF